jgi:hypothetical protein
MVIAAEELAIREAGRGSLGLCSPRPPSAYCLRYSQIGPFLDSNNEKIKTGDADQTAAELFYTQFTENLHDFLEASPDSLVLIVPSVRDMISRHCVYPQAPLDISGLFGDPVGLP